MSNSIDRSSLVGPGIIAGIILVVVLILALDSCGRSSGGPSYHHPDLPANRFR
jgi:hypothetical protein